MTAHCVGTTFRTKIQFGGFIDLSDQNEQYHTQYYPKYEISAIENKSWDYPFNIYTLERVTYLIMTQVDKIGKHYN